MLLISIFVAPFKNLIRKNKNSIILTYFTTKRKRRKKKSILKLFIVPQDKFINFLIIISNHKVMYA